MATLNDKNVGSVIKIKENGVDVDYLIVHKGNPDTNMYDASCNGVWVLRKNAHSKTISANWNYVDTDLTTWLNGEFLNTIDPQIRNAIKQVKIPYYNGQVMSGAEGLVCKAFLLSGCEVGFYPSSEAAFLSLPRDGARLSYFIEGNNKDETAMEKRVCTNDKGTGCTWWLRSPNTKSSGMWYVDDGGGGNAMMYTTCNMRPAFVLPSNLLVNSDGTVSTNTPPTITSDKTGNLGTLTDGFTCNYSVNDADAADTVTVMLTLDGTQVEKFSAEKGKQYTYDLTGNEWLKITNGSHNFKIAASDGKDTVESAATFSRAVSGAAITLETPLEADDIIRACSLYVKGSLPTDTDLLCEVTNNGNDIEPVWEDCTIKVKAGLPYAFKNKTTEKGFAFNFRVTANRGLSNTGGYISEVTGGFE